MPFIGNQPALSYTSFAKQDFTTSATTSYTLDNPVANANELALFINFVRQEPTTAYSASGTSLTLTSATSSSDDMYCVFLGKAVQTVNPPSGSVGISQLSATGTKDATTFLRGDNTFASAGGTNTPAFYARMSADQSLSNNTYAKVNFDTEDFDVGSCYDHSSNYRFTVPSGEAGKYFIGSSILLDSATVSYFSWGYNTIYKNGSAFVSNHQDDKNGQGRSKNLNVNGVYDLSEGDYLEIYAFISLASTSAAIVDANDNGITSYFYGYKILT